MFTALNLNIAGVSWWAVQTGEQMFKMWILYCSYRVPISVFAEWIWDTNQCDVRDVHNLTMFPEVDAGSWTAFACKCRQTPHVQSLPLWFASACFNLPFLSFWKCFWFPHQSTSAFRRISNMDVAEPHNVNTLWSFLAVARFFLNCAWWNLEAHSMLNRLTTAYVSGEFTLVMQW